MTIPELANWIIMAIIVAGLIGVVAIETRGES